MPRQNEIKFRRVSRAQMDSLAGSSDFVEAEPYLITDEKLLAIATAADAYVVIGRHKAASGTLSSTSSQSISLVALLAAGYTKFELYLNAIAPAVDGSYLVMDVSTNDGVSSYLNSDYYSPGLSSLGGSTPSSSDASSRENFIVSGSSGNGVGQAADASVKFRITASRFIISSNSYHVTSSGFLRRFVMDGGHPTAGINRIRFYQHSGAMASGSWELYAER